MRVSTFSCKIGVIVSVGAVFQVLVTNEDGEIVCDMEQSAVLASQYE